MKELLSPKQVAASIGVSESSLKRWCDQGVLATERTPGGHRRIRVGEVMRFLRDADHRLVRPEVLGLPAGTGLGPRSSGRVGQALFDALREGDAHCCRRLVFDEFLRGAGLVRLCDELIAPALHAIGDAWQCGELQIYQEHRACEVLNRILYDLRQVLPPPAASAPTAIGGTPPGDFYRIATLMVELVLADLGWNAMSLGSSLPYATLAAAARSHEPDLFWLSFSHVPDLEEAREEFAQFLDQSPPAMRVVVGGRELDGALGVGDPRVSHCANLLELHDLVSALPQTPRREGSSVGSPTIKGAEWDRGEAAAED